jgi:hypothetical protein
MPKRDLTWWFWLATDAALAWSLLVDREAIKAAIGLAAIQIPVFARRGGGLTSFPAQVRLAYTALLVIGLWVPLIHWIQLAGTTAMVLCGYCFLARCLSLLPFNRQQNLDLDLVRETFLSKPVQGSILAARNAAALR